eukprot:GFUD01012625.1.p1 GENE.GFUD01012625.1~~GFUD01012625.1.p1  ORF type:complete len:135 (+),score=33.95 GFUD01012625.1:85-489(+)
MLDSVRSIFATLLFSVLLLDLQVATAARDFDAVNFVPELTASVVPREGGQRQSVLRQRERQSVLGCLRGCTKELRPVRGEQGGRERILPNKCTFDIEVCKTQKNRQAPLFLSKDQSNVVYPSVGRTSPTAGEPS